MKLVRSAGNQSSDRGEDKGRVSEMRVYQKYIKARVLRRQNELSFDIHPSHLVKLKTSTQSSAQRKRGKRAENQQTNLTISRCLRREERYSNPNPSRIFNVINTTIKLQTFRLTKEHRLNPPIPTTTKNTSPNSTSTRLSNIKQRIPMS